MLPDAPVTRMWLLALVWPLVLLVFMMISWKLKTIQYGLVLKPERSLHATIKFKKWLLID